MPIQHYVGIYISRTSPCTNDDMVKLGRHGPLMEDVKICSSNCTTEKKCIDCIKSTQSFNGVSRGCNICIAQLASCVMEKCYDSCLTGSLDPYTCESCAKNSGCAITKCTSPNTTTA